MVVGKFIENKPENAMTNNRSIGVIVNIVLVKFSWAFYVILQNALEILGGLECDEPKIVNGRYVHKIVHLISSLLRPIHSFNCCCHLFQISKVWTAMQ